MGSTPLEAFRQHIDRVGLENRPVVFATCTIRRRSNTNACRAALQAVAESRKIG